MTKRRSLILGGMGFVGRNLVDMLLLENKIVKVIDVNIHKQSWPTTKAYEENHDFSAEVFDCVDIARLKDSISSFAPDRVFHLAANSDISKSEEIANDYSNTLLSTLALCEVMRLGVRIPSLIFASSSAIYGAMTDPMRVDPDSVCLPTNAYGWTKRASELALIGACKEKDTRLAIARFPNVVGPYLTHGLLFDIIRKSRAGHKVIQILGDGSQKKPFIHVEDLLKILIQKSDVASDDVLIFNIAPRDQITVKEIVSIFESEIQGRISFLYQEQREGWPGDVPEYVFDVEESKANGTLTNISSERAVTRAIRENLQGKSRS
jgi:UDP-glucose 4-epimerase